MRRWHELGSSLQNRKPWREKRLAFVSAIASCAGLFVSVVSVTGLGEKPIPLHTIGAIIALGAVLVLSLLACYWPSGPRPSIPTEWGWEESLLQVPAGKGLDPTLCLRHDATRVEARLWGLAMALEIQAVCEWFSRKVNIHIFESRLEVETTLQTLQEFAAYISGIIDVLDILDSLPLIGSLQAVPEFGPGESQLGTLISIRARALREFIPEVRDRLTNDALVPLQSACKNLRWEERQRSRDRLRGSSSVESDRSREGEVRIEAREAFITALAAVRNIETKLIPTVQKAAKSLAEDTRAQWVQGTKAIVDSACRPTTSALGDGTQPLGALV